MWEGPMEHKLKNKYTYELEEDYIKLGIEHKKKLISVDLSRIEPSLRKLINKTNMMILDDGYIKLGYELVYDLYYDEEIVEKLNENNEIINIIYQKKIDTYKLFQLPEPFHGFIRVQNLGNFSVDEKVIFEIEFWLNGKQVFQPQLKENIISIGSINYLLSEDIYKLIKQLIKYNKQESLNKNQYEQYSSLKSVKDALNNTDFFINKRLEMIEQPILVDEISLTAQKTDEGVFILPQVFSDEQEQSAFGDAFERDHASNIFRLGNKKVIFKNKATVKKVHEYKNMDMKEFKDVLDGNHEINFMDDVNLDDLFSPRVTGLGLIELKQAMKMTRSGQQWFDGNFSKYPIIIEDKEGESCELNLNDLEKLKTIIESATRDEVVSIPMLIGSKNTEVIATVEEVEGVEIYLGHSTGGLLWVVLHFPFHTPVTAPF